MQKKTTRNSKNQQGLAFIGINAEKKVFYECFCYEIFIWYVRFRMYKQSVR